MFSAGLFAQAFQSCGESPAGMAVAIPDTQFDPNAPDLANMASITVDVAVPTGVTIEDMTASMKINHTWIGDLTIYLEAPNGDILALMSEPGTALRDATGDSSDLDEAGPVTFSDDGATDAEAMGNTIGGTLAACVDDMLCDYFPNGDGIALPAGATGALVTSFADFFAQGDGLGGNWTLYVGDDAGGDTGSISGEMMAFTLCVSGVASGGEPVAFEECGESPAGMAVAIPDTQFDPNAPDLADMASITVDVNVPAGATIDDVTASMKINHTWVGDLTIYLEAPNGDILPLMSEPGTALRDATGDSSDIDESGPVTFSDGGATDAEAMGSTIAGGSVVCVDDLLCDYFPNGDGIALPAGATGALVTSFADFFAQGDGLGGDWTLYVGDDAGGDTGSISGEMMAFTLCVSGTATGIECVADFDCEETINVSLSVDAEATITVEDLILDGAEFCEGDVPVLSQTSFGCTDIGETVVTLTVGEQTCDVAVVVDGDNVPDANLACLGRINLTLNDECQGLLLPEMVLTGDRQCLDLSGLEVIVQDSDPSNGPIVDGCGEFTYTVRVRPGNLPTEGFVGDFAPENWIFAAFYTDGFPIGPPSIGTAGFSDPETITLQTLADNSGVNLVAFGEYTFSEPGTVNFSYDYNGQDAGFDDAVVLTGFEGNVLAVLLDTDMPASGELTFDVNPGDAVQIQLIDDGFAPLFSDDPTAPSVLSVTDFSFTPPQPLMDAFAFTNCWGTINAEDKTPPAIEATPDDVTLLCVDFENDANNISTLPASVDKCYRVSSATGATIPGTMAPALRARLLAGGLTPLVPLFTDGCTTEIEVCVSDAVVFGNDPQCDDIVLTRTFTATEVAVCPSAAGETNESVTASYEITFERPTLDDLDGDNIEEVVNIERCGTANPTRADYPAPRAGDFPFLEVGGRTFPLRDGAAVCNIGVTFSDGDPIVTCPFTYKFVRTYTVIDWCQPDDVRTFTQVVKVGDTTPPVFTGPVAPINDDGDLVFGTNAGNICAAFLRLDAVSAVDNCSGTNVTISAAIYPNRDLNGTPIGSFDIVPGGSPELSSAIPAGRHILRYTYTDQCGNTGTEDFDFVVEDQTPPVAICEDGLNISISGGANNGFAVLTPANIDAGSYDDCSAITRAIARVNANNLAIGGYHNELTITCADIGIVRVGLRVTDALGNENFCWLDVLVEDKLPPTCVAPGDVVITCEEYNTTLPADIMDASDETLDALFGTAAGVDNCGTTITQRISGDVNSCGVGRFTRTFVSTDDAGFVNTGACTQRIRVDGVHDYRLTFPTDESSDCAVIPEYDGVEAEELACDLITTTTDVDTLRTLDAGDECFKLRITYDIVNWCEYNTFGEPYLVPRDGDGVNNRQRFPRDLEADVLYLNVLPGLTTTTTDDDRAFMTLFTDRVFSPNAPQRDQPVDDKNNDGDDNDYGDNDADSRGFFRYVQFVKIYDEVAPVIEFTEPAECFAGSGEGCTTTVTIEFSATDACSDAVVGVELDADYVATIGFVRTTDVIAVNDGEGNFTVTMNNIPVGEHALRVRASDGCGNFDVQIIEFCVTADRTPTPICIQTLTVTLMDDGNNGGIAAIWASDFIASPIVDCFGNPVTKYSLYRCSESEMNGFVPAVGQLGIDDINCADVGDLCVRVYAFDDNGSTPDYCEVVVEVQDNNPWCNGTGGNLAGLIATDNNEAVAGVSVALTSADGMDDVAMTGADGSFSFENLTLGGDYTVQPAYDAAFSNRDVKTSDLVAQIAEILGTEPFDSPYDYIAADVNRDGEHDVRDVVASSRAILGITNGFAAGNWVFVAADATIDMSNPYAEAFPEVYNVNDLAGNFNNASFVAVMVGDIVRAEGRSAQIISVEDVQLAAGQTHTLVLDGSALAGFQGTIELAAGLELVAADYTGEGALNLNSAAEGMIALAVRNEATVTLEVRATEAGLLSELVSLTDAITVREGVTAAGVSNGLALNFSGVATTGLVNGLAQNTPNPVADVTNIAYTLATAGKVTLSIQDVQGRTVLVRNLEGVAGRNVTTINVSELGGAAGMLSYTLTAGDFSATKKMVVVR
jgi:subtilisin-like proprotein convertase family protein